MCGQSRPSTTRNIPLRTPSRWLDSAMRGFFSAGMTNPVSRPIRNRANPMVNSSFCN
ncbi:Uncharacterised protein [Mycobacterium tuberculosis]|uniref:Uncharacterized protein n=1 Tax=Mycobacterium tuberculosis TaxID=1773 RepID=A0A655JEF2_MYCTX|nr:Uncharacterised protein [Mycobacterium tuberculosis]COW33629.1 Uncharacterised protein [Mycobacterium tuberculosis]COW77644.1 Uncharacterised protein [Mycobacterium tuberculosis]COX05167.1 Uncharacterised protein [Mycobacterium tuberculosis]COX56677.1 Uncharacterised protein [Mycobacterium tuberculosis]